MATRKYFDLAGKHALVTAAVTPVAGTLASALAEAGATVSVTTLCDDAAEAEAAQAILDGLQATLVGLDGGLRGQSARVDLTETAMVKAAIDDLEQAVAPVDILVNGAHHALVKPTLDMTMEDWRASIDRNATSVFVASQVVGQSMMERGARGRIINLVSIVHDRGVPNCSVFGASQGAVLGFTKSLALEWGRRGVNVNALGLGFMDDVAGPHGDPELHSVLQRYIPMGRTGKLEDLVGALLYLASDEAGFVNAEFFLVDGALNTHG